MSQAQSKSPDEKRAEKLDELYDLREELEQIADSDARYSEYAQNFLESLREAGYDV